MNISQKDIDILRKLADRKMLIANDPINIEKRNLWLKLDEGISERPLVLAETGGIVDKNKALSDSLLECENTFSRKIELEFRNEIYNREILQDDHVCEPWFNCSWDVKCSDFGVQKKVHNANDGVKKGAYNWDAPIKDIQKDFYKLKHREFAVDKDSSYAEKETYEKIFGDIIPVRMRSKLWWTLGLTHVAIDLIGLEPFMLFMYDDPDGLHQLMSFLKDDHLNFAKWAEKEEILSLNNENDYIGSGSMGYTKTLPVGDANAIVRTQDQWLLLESQETVSVGPDQFEEFVFPYQNDIAKHFGNIYYGCCEPVHNRWHILKRIKNIKRVSISPWCDEEIMASELKSAYVYSRKPNPTLISTHIFDENLIRNDIRKTLEITKGGMVELVMKDVHTLNEDPNRIVRWVQIAKEEIDQLY